jgi:hypothetical protein
MIEPLRGCGFPQCRKPALSHGEHDRVDCGFGGGPVAGIVEFRPRALPKISRDCAAGRAVGRHDDRPDDDARSQYSRKLMVEGIVVDFITSPFGFLAFVAGLD